MTSIDDPNFDGGGKLGPEEASVGKRKAKNPAASKATKRVKDEENGEETSKSDSTSATVGEKFVKIPYLKSAGIGKTDEPCTFFRRKAFEQLTVFIREIVHRNRIGLVDGLPGTGKSSTIWWALQQPEYHHKNIAWIHFDTHGMVESFVKIVPNIGEENERGFKIEDHSLVRGTSEEALRSIKADILVLDGVNHNNFLDYVRLLPQWVKEWKPVNEWKQGSGPRCAFLTMSDKIKRLADHEQEIRDVKEKDGLAVAQRYCTQHSWTLKEYLEALVKADNATEGTPLFEEKRIIFEKEWKRLLAQQCKRLGDSRKKMFTVRDVIMKKFVYAGGSARWMMNNTTDEIDEKIRQRLLQCNSITDLLSFTLGHTSSLAKTHLYSSSLNKYNNTVYSMVSERATILTVEFHGTNGIKQMYRHAAKLNNPSFLGWVIEADLLNRCRQGKLVMVKKSEKVGQTFDTGTLVEFDYNDLLLLYNEGSKSEMAEQIKGLVPDQGKTRTCKPSAWNQGGYGVVFIETRAVSPKTHLVVRFGQVTKSETHSLKLEFFDNFLKFLVKAGCVIHSVELGFIVPSKQVDKFYIRQSQVSGTGRLSPFTRYRAPRRGWLSYLPNFGTGEKFKQNCEHEQIQVYGLDLTSMGFYGT